MNIFDGVDKQMFITNRLPAPVDIVGDSSTLRPITAETIQFYYYDAVTGWTIDAGEDAGTVVMAVLGQTGVLDNMGAMLGNDLETSFEFVTGTILPNADIQKCDNEIIESPGYPTLNALANKITENFDNGEWCLDHRNGVIYGKKATAGTSDTANYNVKTQSSISTDASMTSIVHGTKNVTTAGTAEVLATSTTSRYVRIVALDINAGFVYVGINGACSATVYLAKLSAGQGVDIDCANLNLIYLDVASDGEGVNYFNFN